jgi:hypothetical protein
MVDYLQTAIFVRKKITKQAGLGDWTDADHMIQLYDVSNIKVTRAIAGQMARRDSYSFHINSPLNEVFENYYNGDGVTTDFTLKWTPIPISHLQGDYQKLYVFLNGSDVPLVYGIDYTIDTDIDGYTGSTLTFTSAPIIGNRNIIIYYPIIEANDLIRIYRWKSGTTFAGLSAAEKTTAIEEGIEGPINEPSLSKQDKNIVEVNGQGLIDAIMSGMAFNNDPPSYPTVDVAIQYIITQLNLYNKNRYIYGGNPTEWADLGNPTVMSTGAAFPTINYSTKYKTAVEIVQELSMTNYTGDGQYIFWINFNDSVQSPGQPSGYKGRYEFIWRSKNTNNETNAIELTEGDEFMEKLDESKSVDDVVNCVIYNAGVDLNGNGIEGLNYNFSFTNYGLRWQYISSTSDTHSTMLKNEQTLNSANFPIDTDTKQATSSFPNNYNETTRVWSGSYVFVSIRTCNDVGLVSNSHPTATSKEEYINYLRYEAKYQGKEKTDALIDLYNRPRFQLKVQFGRNSSLSFALGGIYLMTFPSFGIRGRYLRIYQIDYNYENTIVTFKEDELTLKMAKYNLF